jgi:hypothetical protein
VTLDESLDQWFALQRTRLEPTNWHNYRTMTSTYLRPELGSTLLAELSARQLDLHYVQLLGTAAGAVDRSLLERAWELRSSVRGYDRTRQTSALSTDMMSSSSSRPSATPMTRSNASSSGSVTS